MSTFINVADYAVQLKQSNLLDLLQDDESILDSAENEAVSEIESALADRYDTENVFNKTGQDRHQYLLKLCRYLVLYEIYKRVPHVKMPDYISEDNAFARLELSQISSGKKGLAGVSLKSDADGNFISLRTLKSEIPRQ